MPLNSYLVVELSLVIVGKIQTANMQVDLVRSLVHTGFLSGNE